ncbi:MAG: HpcH/HpaI aldolase/citrate lyase family protein [Lachnospiraceae bacterium]|nr:HpcH/HpaI aldolase/citrate lyase family protein [Lachnospiraceae bacterium]
MKNSILYYSVGALLYCPANKRTIADSIINEKFGNKFSLALCLEDTINDDFVVEAEQDLIASINQIFISFQKQPFYLPKIFIRVRNPEQIGRLTKAFGNSIEIITGYIIPKFTCNNARPYIQEIIKANEQTSKKIYVMPIYESSSIIDLRNRIDILYKLKDMLSSIEELVLNIRVGGNDLCHMFGFRRHSDESIHRIKPISNIFSDIVTVYGMDYVVSGPVWEYYSGDNWEKGLIQEIQDDKLCGFTGKTAIHPNQIPIINKSYQVSRSDFNDAQAILNWNISSNSFVSGNFTNERMNEYKVHNNWAQQTLFLAEAFGIKD